jgi:uncharacterized protein (DUF1501 family)
MSQDFKKATRRDLMKQMLSVSAVAPLTIQLQAMGAAVSNATDYKALICIYMGGGNDHWGTLSPFDQTNYNVYAKNRGGLARPKNELLRLTPVTDQKGRESGLHPQLPYFKKLWDQKRLAIVPSVGVLEFPMVKSDYTVKGIAPPLANGSHSNGNDYWHTLNFEGTRFGWGGRIMDLVRSSNTSALFASVSAGHYNSWGIGPETMQYQVAANGLATNLGGTQGASLFGSPALPKELLKLYNIEGSGLMEKAYLDVTKRVTLSADIAKQAFQNTSNIGIFKGASERLGPSLNSIARMILQNQFLGVKRQIFFADFGQFDMHFELEKNHPPHLRDLNDSIEHLYTILDAAGLSNNVVTFTTSEFGRKMIPNGDGTDHGWAGTGFVIGGAVKGGDYYGGLQNPDVNGPDFIPRGIGGDKVPVFDEIPRNSVEQYAATMARWFGVADQEMNVLFPRLSKFSPRYFNFL